MEADSAGEGNAPLRDPAFTALVLGTADRDAVFRALDKLHSKHRNITILTGDNHEAGLWADDHGRPFIRDPRGTEFLTWYLPQGVVAFADADTWHAEAAGVPVWRVA